MAKLRCEQCRKIFHARKDARYCSQRCRSIIRVLDARIMTPRNPRSGTPGVSWNRIISRWTVKVKLDGHWKYIGSEKSLSEALKLKSEVEGC